MFTYWDADVILKMELIFKRRSNTREGNQQLLSHSPHSATLTEVPLSPTSGWNLSFGLFHDWPRKMNQSLSKTQ